MVLFVPVPRTTILIPQTGPAHDPDRAHLFVVLTTKCQDGKVLLVPICSVTNACDRTCLLDSKDHQWIKHPSYVMYAEALVIGAQELSDRVNKGDVTYKGLMPEAVYAHIAIGLTNSRRTARKIKAYYEANKA